MGISFPFGDAASEALSASGDQAISINEQVSYIDGVSVEATGNRTINLSIGSDVRIGARIIIASKTNGTETTIFGTGITGTTITGVAGKTITREAVYTGSGFVLIGEQID